MYSSEVLRNILLWISKLDILKSPLAGIYGYPSPIGNATAKSRNLFILLMDSYVTVASTFSEDYTRQGIRASWLHCDVSRA